MNEQANKALSDMIANAASGLNGAIEFSKQQIPDVVNQVLVWNSVSSILSQICCLAIIVFFSFKMKKSLRLAIENDTATGVICYLNFIAGLLLVPSAIIFFFCRFDWLQIMIAPKLYLLEYASHLIKG